MSTRDAAADDDESTEGVVAADVMVPGTIHSRVDGYDDDNRLPLKVQQQSVIYAEKIWDLHTCS